MRGRRFIIQNLGLPVRFAHDAFTARRIAHSFLASYVKNGSAHRVEIVDTISGTTELVE